MKTKIIIFALLCSPLHGWSQTRPVTFNTDPCVMNQFSVASTGVGDLRPQLWYKTLHESYYRDAHATNKSAMRGLDLVSLHQEEAHAENIDSMLQVRAEIAAKDAADCLVDLSWEIDGRRVQRAMQKLYATILSITHHGGSSEDYLRWRNVYLSIKCGLDAVRGGTMPNSKRHEQYLAIYSDVCQRQAALNQFLTMKMLSSSSPVATSLRIARPAAGASSALRSWHSIILTTGRRIDQ